MPIKPFMQLFQKWQGNWFLTLSPLRMKSVTLLALAMILRPSDLTPKAAIFNKEKQDLSGKLSLTTDDVQFNQDGTMTITLHGIKNDYSRDGFEVTIPPAAEINWIPLPPFIATSNILNTNDQSKNHHS